MHSQSHEARIIGKKLNPEEAVVVDRNQKLVENPCLFVDPVILVAQASSLPPTLANLNNLASLQTDLWNSLTSTSCRSHQMHNQT